MHSLRTKFCCVVLFVLPLRAEERICVLRVLGVEYVEPGKRFHFVRA